MVENLGFLTRFAICHNNLDHQSSLFFPAMVGG